MNKTKQCTMPGDIEKTFSHLEKYKNLGLVLALAAHILKLERHRED